MLEVAKNIGIIAAGVLVGVIAAGLVAMAAEKGANVVQDAREKLRAKQREAAIPAA
jgi:hypothetical protein